MILSKVSLGRSLCSRELGVMLTLSLRDDDELDRLEDRSPCGLRFEANSLVWRGDAAPRGLPVLERALSLEGLARVDLARNRLGNEGCCCLARALVAPHTRSVWSHATAAAARPERNGSAACPCLSAAALRRKAPPTSRLLQIP